MVEAEDFSRTVQRAWEVVEGERLRVEKLFDLVAHLTLRALAVMAA